MADEILIADYDPRWPGLFAEEDRLIRAILGRDLVAEVHHIGSTAVPGLAAKPIIDLLVVTPSLEEAKRHGVALLEVQGYSYWRDNPAPHRLFFVKGLPPRGPRTHHVHMVEADSPHGSSEVQDRLLFRDYLRIHPAEAQRYLALKHALAGKFPDDREAYTSGKDDYVAAVLAKARQARPGPPQ
ncbi:MAG: GrpB family protein [Verrucomicrobiota bacterium]